MGLFTEKLSFAKWCSPDIENSNSLKIHSAIASYYMAWKAFGGMNQIEESSV
jgi:hypothetical protein